MGPSGFLSCSWRDLAEAPSSAIAQPGKPDRVAIGRGEMESKSRADEVGVRCRLAYSVADKDMVMCDKKPNGGLLIYNDVSQFDRGFCRPKQLNDLNTNAGRETTVHLYWRLQSLPDCVDRADKAHFGCSQIHTHVLHV